MNTERYFRNAEKRAARPRVRPAGVLRPKQMNPQVLEILDLRAAKCSVTYAGGVHIYLNGKRFLRRDYLIAVGVEKVRRKHPQAQGQAK